MTKVITLQPEFVKGKYEDNYRQVPKLTLRGKWLKDAGFHPHQTVHVTVENGKMTIIAPPMPEQRSVSKAEGRAL